MQDTTSPVEVARGIIENVSTVIVGKVSVVEQALSALIAQGHMLVEDVPGVGKTMLAKSLAISVGCSFKRIQFTPDLLPSDARGEAPSDTSRCLRVASASDTMYWRTNRSTYTALAASWMRRMSWGVATAWRLSMG